MKCPTCANEGNTSMVFPHGSTTTLMGWSPYYDEDGNYHNHDPNIIKTRYSCSNGHKWVEEEKSSCPTCDSEKNQEN